MTNIIKVGYPTIDDMALADIVGVFGNSVPLMSATDLTLVHPDTFWIEQNSLGQDVLCRATVDGTCPKIVTLASVHMPKPFVIVEDFIGGRPSKPPHK